MKGISFLQKILLVLLCVASGHVVSAQDCVIHLMTAPVEQADDVPVGVNEQLMTRFARALTSCGVAASTDYSPFFITGRFSTELKDVVAGPPATHVVKTTLTIFVGDTSSQNIYTSYSIDLRGVGNTEERAYINALKGFRGNDPKLKSAIETAKHKIIDYYDQQYPQILTKASRAASMRNYEEALMYATSIPECSKGFEAASVAITEYYQDYIDGQGEQLLMMARGAWAESPDASGAAEASRYLAQIDPNASCYAQAKSLVSSMQEVTKDNWDFEHKEKHRDQVDLERRRIAAARAVGVAYGNNQQRKTIVYRNTWIR